ARWHAHVNHVQAPAGLRDWLTESGSLTARLVAHSKRFRVRRLNQQRALGLIDEYATLELPRRVQVQQREVLLECDDTAVVYAHTCVPLTATRHDWPFFGSLGERSLGTTLFGDPRVIRGPLQYARLSARHPLVRRASLATGLEVAGLFARRCL